MRRSLLVLTAAAALAAVALVPAATAAPVKRTATVTLEVTTTKLLPRSAAGTAAFTGRLAGGATINGQGRVLLAGRTQADGTFVPSGKGTISFTATATRNGTAVPVSRRPGTLVFAASAVERTATGFTVEATLGFLSGGSGDGQGI